MFDNPDVAEWRVTEETIPDRPDDPEWRRSAAIRVAYVAALVVSLGAGFVVINVCVISFNMHLFIALKSRLHRCGLHKDLPIIYNLFYLFPC